MDWLEHFSYAGIFLTLLAAGLGVPIPEDIPLVMAGYLCHLGKTSLSVMLPVAFAGVLAGDFILFGMGRRFGDHVIEHRITRRLFRRTTLDAVKARYHRHGMKIIFAGRFMPGARAMIFVAAGIVGIPLWKFALVNGGAALISVPTLVILGKIFGDKSEELLGHVRHVEHYIAGGLILLALLTVAIHLVRTRRAPAISRVPPAVAEPQGSPPGTQGEAVGATCRPSAATSPPSTQGPQRDLAGKAEAEV